MNVQNLSISNVFTSAVQHFGSLKCVSAHNKNNKTIKINKFIYLSIVTVFIFSVFFGNKASAAEVVSFQVVNESDSTQVNIPFTIGHVFKEGAVPVNSGLSASLPGGASVNIQIDKKASHSDGSLRHAIISGRISSLAGNASDTVTLSNSGDVAATPVALTDLLASSFDATAMIIISGATYTASAQDLLQNTTPKIWLAGDQASEWIVSGAVKDASGNAHPYLTAYFHVRAYAGIDKVKVDVVIENGWTYVNSPGDFTYSVEINVGGQSVYSNASLNHYSRTRWHKNFWWGDDPLLYIKPDMQYLRDTKAVPNYASLTPSETYLDGLRSITDPMDNGDHKDYMPATGAQDGIGPLPRWDATYIVSGADKRAYDAMLANSDGAGAYDVHHRDENTGLPVSIMDYPNEYLFYNSGIPGAGVSGTPYTPDKAHQPSMAYLPYLITGDYFYLEELQFWASWNAIGSNEYYRGFEKGIFGDQGVQVRGRAWSLRTLGQVAYITPDDHDLKAFFVESLQHNIDFYDANYVNNTEANKLGVIPPYGFDLFVGRPWMDDFFTFAYGYLVDLGFTNAIPMRDWKAQYVIDRIGKANAEGSFCWQFSAAYASKFGDTNNNQLGTNEPSKWYQSFDEYWEGNFGNKQSNSGVYLRDIECGTPAMTSWVNEWDDWNGTTAQDNQIYESYPGVPDSYLAYLQPAVAVTVDADLPESTLVNERFDALSSVQPGAAYNDKPHWAVIPRATAVDIGKNIGAGTGEGTASGGAIHFGLIILLLLRRWYYIRCQSRCIK